MKSTELMAKLRELHGIDIDRRTLYTDIKVLNKHGYEVFCKKSRQNEYYIIERQFDIPELRVLMDAVEAANFISEKQSRELLDKVASLGGSYHQKLLLRNNSIFHTTKHSNDEIFNSIFEIEEAVNRNKKVEFKYFDLDYQGNQILRKEGKKYEVNPVATLFTNDRYYLVCFSDKYQNYSNYRIDRMLEVKKLDKERTESNLIEEFDAGNYRKQLFGMFVGEPQDITLSFDSSMIDVIFDKFGENILISKKDDSYQTTVQVVVSDQFYGWLVGLGGKVALILPINIVDKFREYIDKIYTLHKGGNYEF